jgi:hypothetical protein
MLSHRILMVLFSDAIRAYKSNSRWDWCPPHRTYRSCLLQR